MKENNIDTTKRKPAGSLIDKSKNFLHKIFYEDSKSYDFSLPDTTNSIVTDKASSYSTDNTPLNLEKMKQLSP